MFKTIQKIRKNLLGWTIACSVVVGATACQKQDEILTDKIQISQPDNLEIALVSANIFVVKDLNGKIIRQFDILGHTKEIETNLLRLGRENDAKKFANTYDLQTGTMKASVVKYLNQNFNNILWYDQTALVYGTHLAGLGWSLGESSAGQPSGTTGQGRRLEAFYLKNTQSWDPTSPKIRYSGKVMNSFWDAQRRMEFEEICGTTGQSRALEFIRIFPEPTDANSLQYHPTYTVHIQNTGDRTGSDGLVVGIAGLQIEQLTLRIYKY